MVEARSVNVKNVLTFFPLTGACSEGLDALDGN